MTILGKAVKVRQPFTICCDFDGTLVEHEYPGIGPECPGASDAVKLFIKEGAKIVLFTMRSGQHLDEAVAWCKSKGIELYGVNTNPSQKYWTKSPKAYGHLYIDDAAYGVPLQYPIGGFRRPHVYWPNVTGTVLDMIRQYKRNESPIPPPK